MYFLSARFAIDQDLDPIDLAVVYDNTGGNRPLLADFFESIKSGKKPAIDGWDALKTLNATALAEQSAKIEGWKVLNNS